MDKNFIYPALILLLIFMPVFAQTQQNAGGSNTDCERFLKDAEQTAYRNPQTALPLYDRLLSEPSCPDSLKCDAYFGRATAKQKTADQSGAIADFSKALQCRPDSFKIKQALGSVYAQRGNLRERLGDMRGAASDYEKAMQFTPDLQEARNGLSSVHYNQGHLKEQRGDLSGAADEYSKALELNPDNPEAASA